MSDSEHPYTATLRFVVREVLQRNPTATYEEVEAAWRAGRGDVDATQLRAVYSQETGRGHQSPAAAREPNSSDSTVLATAVVWVLAHFLIWVMLAAPSNFRGIFPGLIALLIGGAQLLYGLVAGFFIRRDHPANSQGVFIGTAAVALLHTALCFAAASAY